MRSWFEAVQKRWQGWWQAPSGPRVPYRLTCSCGRVTEGFRAATHRIHPCAECGRKLFILPYSPFPRAFVPPVDPPPGPARPVWGPWVIPGLATVSTLLIVTLLLVWIVEALRPPGEQSSPTSARGEPVSTRVIAQMEVAQALLAKGNFREAHKQLKECQDLVQGHPESLSPRARRSLQQLSRQADLLAQLLREPLEDIVRQAQLCRSEEEWQAQFRDFQGKGVFFDDWFRRQGKTFVQQGYEVRVGTEVVRVEFDLALLGRMENALPRRLLLGARLASVAREREGRWVIRFEPESGVLLTDEGAAAACGLAPLDADLRGVIAWQAEWIRNNP